jgi:hypothetical protein
MTAILYETQIRVYEFSQKRFIVQKALLDIKHTSHKNIQLLLKPFSMWRNTE